VFAAVVIGGDLRVIEDGEKVIVDVSPAQVADVVLRGRERHRAVEVALHSSSVFGPLALGQIAMATSRITAGSKSAFMRRTNAVSTASMACWQ